MPNSAANKDRFGSAPDRRFVFRCKRCDSPLEARTAVSGQIGRCPTCGARFRIPGLDAYHNCPGDYELLDPHDQDPTPIHAYAASGASAPHILRVGDERLLIECAQCGERSEITANVCRRCGVPFTIEGSELVARSQTPVRPTVAVALGLISFPLCWVFVPALGAVALGLLGLCARRPGERAFADVVAITLGVLSLLVGAALWLA